jgi:hypothetical protein
MEERTMTTTIQNIRNAGLVAVMVSVGALALAAPGVGDLEAGGAGEVRSAICAKMEKVEAVLDAKIHAIVANAAFAELADPPDPATGLPAPNPYLEEYVAAMAFEASNVAEEIAAAVQAAIEVKVERMTERECAEAGADSGSLGGDTRAALAKHLDRLFPQLQAAIYRNVVREATLALAARAPAIATSALESTVDAMRWDAELARHIEATAEAIAEAVDAKLAAAIERFRERELAG